MRQRSFREPDLVPWLVGCLSWCPKAPRRTKKVDGGRFSFGSCVYSRFSFSMDRTRMLQPPSAGFERSLLVWGGVEKYGRR